MILNAYGTRRAAEVMEDTWGHLRPATGRHAGWILAAFSAYGGERLLVDAEFAGVPDSPWLYERLCALINDADLDEGEVYRFSGACVVGDEIGFDGRWEPVGDGGTTDG